MRKNAKQCVLQERAEGIALTEENDNDGQAPLFSLVRGETTGKKPGRG